MHTPNTIAIIRRAQEFIDHRQQNHHQVTDAHVRQVDHFFHDLETDSEPIPTPKPEPKPRAPKTKRVK